MIAVWVWTSSETVVSHSDGPLFPDRNATVLHPASRYTWPLNRSLGVPLNPTHNMGFWARTTGTDTRAGSFNEASLVACIVAMVSRFSWSDPPDIPITALKTERRCRDMLFTIQPSLLPGADFTTYKAGIAFLIVLRDLFSLRLWHCGHITTGIAKYDTDKAPHPWGLPIGTLYIEKLAPQVGTTENLAAAKDDDNLISSVSSKSEISNDSGAGDNSTDGGFYPVPKKIRERKWLGCYAKMVSYIFSQAWDSRVQQIVPAGRHAFPLILHFRSDVDLEMEANITLVRDLGPVIWLSVLGAALELCEIAATNDRWDYKEAIWVEQQGRPSVKLSIGPTWRDGPR